MKRDKRKQLQNCGRDQEAGMARGFCLSEEAALGFEAQDLWRRTAMWRRLLQPFRVQSGATVSPMMRKKSLYPDITGSFFKASRQSWIQQRTGTCVIKGQASEIAACPPGSPICRHPSALLSAFHLLSLPPVSKPSLPVHAYASCCIVLALSRVFF